MGDTAITPGTTFFKWADGTCRPKHKHVWHSQRRIYSIDEQFSDVQLVSIQLNEENYQSVQQSCALSDVPTALGILTVSKYPATLQTNQHQADSWQYIA